MATVNSPDNRHTQSFTNADSVICVQQVTKSFGEERVVKGVTFNVPRASIFGFVGPSGSGKTTTVRLLTGIYVPTEGSIAIFNSDPAKFSQEQRAKIGYMTQLFVLYPNLTVWENMNFTASIYGMSLFRRKRLKKTLEFVELYDHRNKLTRNISGGMQRRLSLAAAMIHEPEILFLDEPTAGIDPILRQKFWEHFKDMQSHGKTLFITTQYVNEADHCDLVGVMSNGKLIIVDTPRGLRHHAYGGDIIDMRSAEPIEFQNERLLSQHSLKTIRTGPNTIRIIVSEASTAIPELMEWAQKNNIHVEALEPYTPPFEDVFMELVRSEARNE
jgi:ABC-2 type transport system ATP-binding protein